MGQVAWQGAVEQIRRAASLKGRQQSGCFSIEGTRLHERGLRANAAFMLVVMADSFANDAAERIRLLCRQLHQLDCPLFVVPDEVMAELTDGRSLGGVISLVRQPAMPDLAALVTAVSNPTLLIAHDIIDPGNIGAMMRTAHANSATAFIVNGGSDPYHPKTVRTSMGSIFKLPVLQRPSTEDFLAELASLGIQTIGTVANEGVSLPDFNFSQQGTAVFMGSEYFGLPDTLLPKLDQLITIPMNEGIDSMSVNAATAVILYEIQNQKRKQSAKANTGKHT